MKPLSLSKEIKEGKLNDLEIIQCLDIHHNQVLVSAISQIVSKKLCNEEIISKLSCISTFRDPNVNKLFGIDTIGHYSIAALLVIGNPESINKYEELMADLDDWDKEIVERIAEGMG
ncbi:hypothetical protein [Paenibacillus lemnae]|uniref:Uncharacterized protein n=1 Tax=Paenibacillus lemnae TaxID=1330551 RepID=A0A848M5W7_PAELE|nr:hypothetical protein [Paenibacillus lemnae]NMO94994.1 hypothetical protein [Paenibacillus lemnae]